jgi:DNA replication protein DnaC
MAMKDNLEQLLTCLKLRKIAEIYERELDKATKSGEPFNRLFARLLRAEWNHQQECALGRRIGRAKIPEQWTIESFPFKNQPGVSQRQIRTLAELDFIARAENIVFIGEPAVGKHNGHSGLFIMAQDLFDQMYATLADRSTRRYLNRLARIDVLLIDEMGYLNIKPEQANIFFKLLHERHRRRPT